jgi:hypothetical protein
MSSMSTEDFISHLSPGSKSAYLNYTYLLPWGIDENLDSTFKSKFNLTAPGPEVAYAIRGHGGNLSLIVPSTSPRCRRWQLSSTLTALHTVAAVSYTTTLMHVESFKNSCSQLVAQLCTILPETLPEYVEPSLDFLVLFWRDPIDDVMQAARSTFIATADRLSPEERKTFAQSWASRCTLLFQVEIFTFYSERSIGKFSRCCWNERIYYEYPFKCYYSTKSS